MSTAGRIVTALLVIVLMVVGKFIRDVVYPPWNFPRNIPTVPFYAVLYGQWRNWDQEKTYKEFFKAKAEKHGAVKMYWGMKWGILVTKPEYLAEVLKQNDTFEKSGNHEKIPYAVLSEYNGDNVISAGNASWRIYRSIITNSILFPDTRALAENTKKVVSRFARAAAEKSLVVAVAEPLQRYTLANIGQCILGVDFRSLDEEKSAICRRLQQIKNEVFKPAFLLLPLLDRLPIPSRQRTRQTVREFKKDYMEMLMEAKTPENMKRLGPKLAEAYEEGVITEKQFQDNATIAMVAGHENPQLLLTSLMYTVAKYPEWQHAVWQEGILADRDGVELAERVVLNAVIYETLRLFPPLGQIVNRLTRRAVTLGGGDILIPKGAYVGYNNFATQRDPQVWGQDAEVFRPDRWGKTMEEIRLRYSVAKSKCTLPAFHGRSRACLGEKFALAEARAFVHQVVGNFEVMLDPTWPERLTAAGPVAPAALRVHLKKRPGRLLEAEQ